MKQQKQGWDTRAWLVGILGGAISGSTMGWAGYPPAAKRFNAVMHSSSASDWVFGVSVFLSLLVLPGVVSGIARRRTFLWGLLPLAQALMAIEVEDRAENGQGHVTQEFWGTLFAFTCCLLVSSGPVSLLRFGQARTQRRREAAAASLAAQYAAASIPHEGVWPPPPEYRQ